MLKQKNLQIFKFHRDGASEEDADQAVAGGSGGRPGEDGVDAGQSSIDIFEAAEDFPDACFRVLSKERAANNEREFLSRNSLSDETEGDEIFTLTRVNLRYRNADAVMVVTQGLTKFIAYQKTKMLAHFYEMLTTTFSHEMQTPLHQQVALIDSVNTMIESPTSLNSA